MQDAERLDMARALVRELEEGNGAAADEIVQQILRQTESTLFVEVGRLTRELHDALTSVERESLLSEIAENEIPDAKERLHYVIERTEAAAHKTLTAVEELLPISSRMGEESDKLLQEWTRFTRRELNIEGFKGLARDVSAFLGDVKENSASLQARLSDVLLAQDYQDLTGQVIRKVIDLVQQVEAKLVDLVRVSGAKSKPLMRKGEGVHAEGPQIGTSTSGTVMNGQDEVDDLLSSLGF